MKKIKIFLASSNELKANREQFEIKIGRKNKDWNGKNILLHLDLWEDLSARMSATRSQDEYNKKVREADLFVLLAYSKVGMYTEEEFETAFGSFQKTEKPFIFIYFKDIETGAEDSLEAFKNKLKMLGHFYASYSSFDSLWNQFNKELDRLLLADFETNDFVQTIGSKIDNRGAYIGEQINSTTFKNTTINYNGVKISKTLGGFPAHPEIFIGRTNSIKDIYQRLSSKKNMLLLVNGEGGIGKTTIASQYYFEYAEYYSHLIWLVSETGIKDAIISLAISLKISFPDQLTPTQQVNEVLRNLSALKRPVLLVIDNANSMVDLDENYQLLRQFQNIDILITSRINNYQHIDTYKVKHLDNKSANELFKKHFEAFKPEEQALLDELLKAIGYNTLVIELLAKNLNEFNNELKEHYPLKKLLKDIQEKGVLALTRSTKVNADYKLQAAKPEAIISTMYDIAPLSENEKRILSIYAVLPATAIAFEYLEQFLPDIEELDRIVLKLSQKGWIDYDKAFKSFKTNPIISEIARTQNKDRIEDDTGALINLFIDKLDYGTTGITHIEGDFNEVKKIVSYAETFVNNYEILNYSKSVLLERLGNFYQTYGNLGKALDYFERDLKLTKELCKINPSNVGLKNGLAISYIKLGDTYTSLGKLEKALDYFERETDLFEELYESNPSNVGLKNGLAIAYLQLGALMMDHLENKNKGLDLLKKAKNILSELKAQHPKYVEFENNYNWVIDKIKSIE